MRARSLLMLSILVIVAPAFAAQRTFVSTGGNDLNTASNCSLASPCRSFGSALSVTGGNGEVVVLDSGGYGSVAIDRSVAIVSPPGVYAGISVFGGTNGVTIDAPGTSVALKGLTINGQGGNAGIDFQKGYSLTIENCEIANVGGSNTAGILARAPNGRVFLRDTLIRNTSFPGIWLKQETVGEKTTLSAENVTIFISGFAGIYVGGIGHVGTVEAYLNRVTVVESSGSGILAESNGSAVLVSISNSEVSRNGAGVTAGGAGVRMVVAASKIARNLGDGVYQANSAVLLSRGDNIVHDNNGGGAQTTGAIGSLPPL